MGAIRGVFVLVVIVSDGLRGEYLIWPIAACFHQRIAATRQEASSPELPAEMPQSSRALFSFRLAASRLSSRVVGIGSPLHLATSCTRAVISKLSGPAWIQRQYVGRR